MGQGSTLAIYCTRGGWRFSNLMYTWRVKMKERREYKIERRPRWRGIEKRREKHCSNKDYTCNQIQKKYIQELISLNCRLNQSIFIFWPSESIILVI